LSQHSEAEDQQEVQGAEEVEAGEQQAAPTEQVEAPEAVAAAPDELFLSVDDSEGELVEIAGPGQGAASDELAALRAELESARLDLDAAQQDLASARDAQGAAERERDEFKGRLMRSAADLDNYRKRVQREKDETARYGASRVVLELLPAVDNMDRALEHADKSTDVSTIVDGIRMVQRQLVSALEKNGVTSFESKGERFDPQRHEAIQQIETSEHETGIVLQEFQRGYYLHDRLIRPALVVVARNVAPAAAAAEPEVIDATPAAGAADAEGGEQEW
jgi:molecular chaperone GrpE